MKKIVTFTGVYTKPVQTGSLSNLDDIFDRVERYLICICGILIILSIHTLKRRYDKEIVTFYFAPKITSFLYV